MSVTNYTTERTILIKAPYSRLSDVMEDLPDNVYLNKTSTGSGATHICLTNSVNYVLLAPYVSLIKNKLEKHNKDADNVLGVFGKMSLEDIRRYITIKQMLGAPLKIMVTYDSFYKVHNVLTEMNLVKDFKVCLDEAHSLISLAKIKGKPFKFFYNHYKQYKSFVFVTATPNDRDLLPKAIRDVEYVRVVWENAVKVNIIEQRVDSVADSNKLVVEICKRHMLNEETGNAYIFYNSVNEIISVIQKLKKMDGFTEKNVNIFCADTDANNKKIAHKLGMRFLDGSFKDEKKLNFLTSTTYEGCDIEDLVGRTYIIVSSKRNSTALTNHILVPQICGRLRNSEYKLEAKMIICGFKDDIYLNGREHFIEELKNMQIDAEYKISRAIKAFKDGQIKTFQEDLESFASNSFIVEGDDGMPLLNDEAFALEDQIYRAFNEFCVTVQGGYEVANTIRTVNNDMFEMSDITKLLIEKKVDFCRLLKQYIRALEFGDESTIKTIEDFSEEHRRYVDVLGIDKIRAVGFHKTKLTNAYNLQVKFNQSNQLIKESLNGLRVGNRYTIKKVLEELKKAYNDAGVKKKPVSTDIKNYFNVKNAWLIDEFGSRCKGYEIISDLYKEDFY